MMRDGPADGLLGGRSGSALAFNPVLHGLRGIAALAVLAFHWTQLFPLANGVLAAVRVESVPWLTAALPLELGWQGVPLFFVLSGFLLTAQWGGRAVTAASSGRYLLRRVLRIYPAVWLQMAVVLAATPLLPWLWRSFSWAELAQTLVLWINMPPTMVKPFNGVWWTLPIELSFYVALPLLVAAGRRIGWAAVIAGSVALTVGWRWAVMARHPGEHMVAHLPVLDMLPGSLATFAAGMFLALTQGSPAWRWTRSILLGAAAAYAGLVTALMVNIATYWSGHWMLAVWNPALGWVIAAALGGLLATPASRRWLGGPVMIWLGERSFGIYLWHFPVEQVMARLLGAEHATVASQFAALPASVALTLICADWSYRLVERRAMRLFRTA